MSITWIDLLQAVLVLVITWAISRAFRFFLNMSEAGKRIEPGVRYSLGRLIHYTFVAIGILLTVRVLGVDLSSLALIGGALGIGIGFGLQSIVANVVSGLVLLFERPIRVGDRITVGMAGDDATATINGVVKNIGLRATSVVTLDNIGLVVPNSEILANTIVNWSFGDPRMRLHILIGVAYESDVARVREIMERVAEEHPEVLSDPAPEVRLVNTNDSSLDFELLAWIADPRRHGNVDAAIREAMVLGFRAGGITIPFPQRDVHMIAPGGQPAAESSP